MLTDVIKLNTTYKDALYSLKDILLHQMPFSKTTRQKQNSKPSNKPSNKQLPNNNNSQPTSSSSVTDDSIPPKISPTMTLNNVDEILESLLELADRASKLLSIISYLRKLCLLQPMVIGLPRVAANNDKELEKSFEHSTEFDSVIDDDSLCSMADIVSRTVGSILEGLRKGCPNGSKEVFVTREKERSVFSLVYLEYLQLVDDFELTVYNYLMVH